jgi:hypothetical protein
LAEKTNVENVGGYNQLDKGKQNWHVGLNGNFYKIEEDVKKITKNMRCSL